MYPAEWGKNAIRKSKEKYWSTLLIYFEIVMNITKDNIIIEYNTIKISQYSNAKNIITN